MYGHKLKLHISVTLFIVLLLGMVLLDAVFFVFWQRMLVQQELDRIETALRLWGYEQPGIENRKVGMLLQSLRNELGDGCLELIWLVDGQIIKENERADRWGLEQLVHRAAKEDSVLVQQADDLGLHMLFVPQTIAVVVPTQKDRENGGAVGVVVTTLAIVTELWQKQKIIGVYILVNALILTTIGFFRMRRVLLRPIDKLIQVAENYQVEQGGGLFNDHVETEFGQLSRAMNDMVHRIEGDREKLCSTVDSLNVANKQLQDAQHEILRAERLAAAGRLSAGLAHEIGNPVAIIQGYLELLRGSGLTMEERTQFTGRALVELERIDGLLRQLLDLTSKREKKNEAIEPATIVHDTVEILRNQFHKKNIETDTELPGGVPLIWGDKEMLRQVVLNCLINAADAVTEKFAGSSGGKILASVASRSQEDLEKVIIKICDNGAGVKGEDLCYLFDPFFSTKDPGKGTGLGLAVSYRIITSMGGKIGVESEYGKGACFCIELPVYTSGNQRETTSG